MHPPGVDLRALAHRAMREAGFDPDTPPAAVRELEAENRQARVSGASASLRDLRGLLWSSIDNPESRDLDQIEYAEALPGGEIRVLIGIADVDAFAAEGGALGAHARVNTTSVYTGVVTFPMLPEALSNGLSSLLPDGDRAAVVTELVVTADGTARAREVFPALVRNHAKLTYDRIGDWLDGNAPLPEEVAAVPGLEAQLRLQDEAAERVRGQRGRQGALEFETIEARTVVQAGRVVDLVVTHKNRARALIENLMVAANTAAAGMLAERGVPSIQRVVRRPERWPRIVELARGLGTALPDEPDAPALNAFLERRRQADPERFPELSLSVVKLLGPGEYAVVDAFSPAEGHFGLAVQNYAHSTAPNRRYADLVTQRVLKASAAGRATPYSSQELQEIADHCTERASAARKVERRMRKSAAAALLHDRIGEIFEALVTGASPKGTFVRVLAPPVEGMVVRGVEGLDVGDRVRVRLARTDVERGFIDFERVGPVPPHHGDTETRSPNREGAGTGA